jgi:hypothetical protein
MYQILKNVESDSVQKLKFKSMVENISFDALKTLSAI